MRKLILIIISTFVLISSPAFAKEAGTAAWIVSQLSGDARVVHPGLRPAALRAQARLEPGDMVVTGVTGRATLTRGGDYIIIAPRSQLRLPSMPQPNGFTRVIQSLGTMLFKVRHTGVPHFAVDTPMLAAVVKGTTFTVIVDKDRSAVQVIQGAVQVTATDGGMSRLVEGGKTVFIDRSAPQRLMDADERSPATTTSSATSSVRLVGSQTPTVAAIANLTEGLVHPGTSAPAATAMSAPTAETTVPPATQPVANVVGTTVPGVTDTVVDSVSNLVNINASGVTDTVSDVVDTAASGVTDTVGDVTDTVTDVVDTTVAGVTDTVTDGVADLFDNSGSGETVVDVVDTTTDTVSDVVDTATDVIDTTVAGATDTVTDVTDTVTDVVDTTVAGVTDTVTGVVTDLFGNSGSGSDNSGPGSDNSGSGSNSGPGGPGDPVIDVVDTTTDTVTDVVDTTTDVVDTTVADVTDTVTDVVDTTTDVVDTTVSTVTDTTTDVIGGVLGGLFPH